MNDALLDELSKATQKVDNPLANAGGLPLTETFTVNETDFDQLELDPENEQPDELNESSPGGEKPPGEVPKKPSRSFKKIATSFVKTFESVVLKMGAKWAYPQILLKEGDAELVVDFRERLKVVPEREQNSFSANILLENNDLRSALTRVEKAMDCIHNAPLSKDEFDMLVDPLAEVIEKYKWMQVGPEANLLLAVIIIMIPRVEPLFPGLMSQIDSKVREKMAQ